jgi:hypothetical protein
MKAGGGRMKIEFEIKPRNREYIVVRKGGAYIQHAHLNTMKGCKLLIRLINNYRLPDSKYLRISCQRLLTDEEYNLLRPGKEMYINVNKGVK